MSTHASAGSLAQNGALKVNKHMQVEGFEDIYAVGDCANVNEPKMAYHAGLHAKVVVTNIINSLAGKALTSYNTGNIFHSFLRLYPLVACANLADGFDVYVPFMRFMCH